MWTTLWMLRPVSAQLVDDERFVGQLLHGMVMDWRDLADMAADLLLGGDCPSCGRPGLGICSDCRRGLVGEPFAVLRPVKGFPETLSQGVYRGDLRRILVRAKERQGLGCLPTLVGLLAESTAALLAGSPVTAVSLVPVPSAPSTVRERGFDLMGSLASGVVRRMHRSPSRVVRWRGLQHARVPYDQAGLDAAGRWRNLEHSLVSRASEPRAVVILDDVVTTGATLCEAARALGAAGHRVLGCAVIASTPKRLARTREGPPGVPGGPSMD